MWEIEVAEDASDEEIRDALLDKVDFNQIRECVGKLSELVAHYGPFKEVVEKSEDSDLKELTRTYHENKGWICDELKTIESQKVWTLIRDQWNNYSWITNGYETHSSGSKEVSSWFVSAKPYFSEKGPSSVFFTTEFIINVNYFDSDGNVSDYTDNRIIDVWDLLKIEPLTDNEVINAMWR